MGGPCRDSNIPVIQRSLESWLATVVATDESWKTNNLHIDEVESLADIERKDWLESSFAVFDVLIHLQPRINMVPFLFIDLSYADSPVVPGIITLSWLQEAVHDSTPPSFNYTPYNVYQDFYCSNLVSHKVEDAMFKLSKLSSGMHFMSHIFYDFTEMEYSRDLSVFYHGR